MEVSVRSALVLEILEEHSKAIGRVSGAGIPREGHSHDDVPFFRRGDIDTMKCIDHH